MKVDIKESEDASTISYKENTTFFFDAKASVGSEGDVINTPNVPLIVRFLSFLNSVHFRSFGR